MNPVPDEGKSRISTKSRLKPWLSLFGLLLIVLVGLAVWRWGGPPSLLGLWCFVFKKR